MFGVSHEAALLVVLGVLGLDIAVTFLYLRRNRRLIDPFNE